MREQPEEHGCTLPVEPALCSFESVQPLSQVFGFLSSAFLIKWVCGYSADRATLTLTSSAAERKPSHCSPSDGTLLSVAPIFLPSCHFFFVMPLGVIFYFLHPHQVIHLHFLTSGLCCSAGSEGEFLSLDRPRLLPSLSCCDSTERSFLLTVSCGAGCVSYPTWRSVGASPHRGFVIAALKENALSFLLGTACCFLSIAPAHTRCPSPSKALLFPSVGSVLWSIFAEEKVTGKQERMGKVVSDLGLEKRKKKTQSLS